MARIALFMSREEARLVLALVDGCDDADGGIRKQSAAIAKSLRRVLGENIRTPKLRRINTRSP